MIHSYKNPRKTNKAGHIYSKPIGFIKLETMVPSENAIVLKYRSYTESHETIFALVVSCDSACNPNLKQ
jgi:hypothetical protein